ncbi:MAG: lysophospholipid acyltransferase family protein [Akkermansiaceae bacterium]|nr:lysophospholipid acyltransferase family protein [Verrucomicrobiales bacterium]
MPPNPNGLPLVLYCNHASWWDALVCLLVKDHFFPERRGFAPIDAAMLRKYKFFQRLGFFGVDQYSRRGPSQFLHKAEAVLRQANSLLVITPQGRFADPRERPPQFAPGLGHLAARVPGAMFVPLAIEYVFWEERLPEILIRFGRPLEIHSDHQSPAAAKFWTRLFEKILAETQNLLAVEAQRRDPTDFRVVLRGGAGQGGIYDCWRSIKATLRGEKFRREHGDK